jgi:anti-sigma factor RsiW
MNPQSFHALVIDRQLGELSPEAGELLELHLAQNPAARSEAERILQSLAVTGDAMLHHPELSRVPPVSKPSAISSWRRSIAPWMMRAAALVLLTLTAALFGFMAGRARPSSEGGVGTFAVVSQPSPATTKPGPWARYRVTYDPAGSGMQVVRVDVSNSEKKPL